MQQPITNNQEFYMLYVEGQSSPTFKHYSKESAETEAKRLAQLTNKTAYLLQATHATTSVTTYCTTALSKPITPTVSEILSGVHTSGIMSVHQMKRGDYYAAIYKYKVIPTPDQITLYRHGFDYILDGITYYAIPLTDKWLEAFGFEIYERGSAYCKWCLRTLDRDVHHDDFRTRVSDGRISTGSEFQYVHQLQQCIRRYGIDLCVK